jgi:glycosyltransferase involved in cell wall biosynthesis
MSTGDHVVYLDHCALESGAELALARLLPALDAVTATVVLAEDGPLVTILEAEGIDVSVVPMGARTRELRRGALVPGLGLLRACVDTIVYSVSLAGTLRRARPDLVVTNSLKAALYGGVAARLARIPMVWHLHDRIATDYLPAPAVTMVRLAARTLPHAVIANSHTTLATLNLPPDRRKPIARVIGNVCPLADRAPARRADLDPAAPLRVGIVGRLAPWKGQDIFLRAFALAFNDVDAHGVVIGGALFGEDEFASSLQKLADELGITPCVRFTGHLKDPWPEMASLDILVHASIVPEPFGQVIVEGMALGVCVVASDTGGPAEIISADVDGVLFTAGDPVALSSVLEDLAKDRTRRERIAAAGPETARRFAPAVIAAAEQDLYRTVLAGRSSSRR